MNLGENIKKYRKEKGLTQTELAIKSNLSKNAIYNYENNKRVPNIDILNKIASALQIPINQLLGDNIEPVYIEGIDLYIGYENKNTGEYFKDDSMEEAENEIKEIDKRINKLNKVKKSKEDLINILGIEFFSNIFTGLNLSLTPIFKDDKVTTFKLIDNKDGYTKIFDTYEEAEQFFNEITHGIQSSVDRLKYYDKNNK